MTESLPTRSSTDRAGSRERIGPYAFITQMATGPVGARWAAQVSEGAEAGRLVSIRRVRVTDKKFGAAHLLHDSGIRAQTIRHPKVAALLDVVREDQELAVVSEFVEGETLNTLLRLAAIESVPIPSSVALGIISDLCEALDAAQAQWRKACKPDSDPLGLAVHGGVTPDVVLVATYGEALLLDAGLVGAAARLPRILKHPSALPYRAPEQLKRTSPVDERSDVYSLGVLLWEMLANRPLFGTADRLRHPESDTMEPADARAIEDEILGKPVPQLDQLPRVGAPVRSCVAALVARALQRTPTERFLTLKGMSEAIRALPGESVAGSEQVAVSVDRLARPLIASRRSAIELATHARVMGSIAPTSGRPTASPADPEKPVTMLVPWAAVPGADSAGRARGFGDNEAPTMPHGGRSAAGAPVHEEPVRPARNPSSAGVFRPHVGVRKITVPGIGRQHSAEAPMPPPTPAAEPSPAAATSSPTATESAATAPQDAAAIEPAPLTIEPVSVEPVSIEPVSIEPVSIEPVSIEPVSVEPVSVEPEPPADTGLREAQAIFVMGETPTAASAASETVPIQASPPDQGSDRPESLSLVAVETEQRTKRGWVPWAAVAVILMGVAVVVGLHLFGRAKPDTPKDPSLAVPPTEVRQDSMQTPAPPSERPSAEAPSQPEPSSSAAAPAESKQMQPVSHGGGTPTAKPAPPTDLKRTPPSQATSPTKHTDEAESLGTKAFRPSKI